MSTLSISQWKRAAVLGIVVGFGTLAPLAATYAANCKCYNGKNGHADCAKKFLGKCVKWDKCRCK